MEEGEMEPGKKERGEREDGERQEKSGKRRTGRELEKKKQLRGVETRKGSDGNTGREDQLPGSPPASGSLQAWPY